MKKLLLVAILATFAVVLNVETAKAQSMTYGYSAYSKDSLVTGDTLVVVPGITLAVSADTLNAVKIKLPTGSQIKSGQIYHIVFDHGVTNLTYLNGSVRGGVPTATTVVVPHTLASTKIVAVGGVFSLWYNKTDRYWYRVQ